MKHDRGMSKRFVGLIAIYLALDLWSLVASLFGQAPLFSRSPFYFWYFLMRLSFLILAGTVYLARRSRSHYLAVFSDLSTDQYWSMVFLSLGASKMLFAAYFVQLSTNYIVEYGIVAFLSVTFLLGYHSKVPVAKVSEQRDSRIRQLVKKAGLSPKEYETVFRYLVDNGKANQRRSLAYTLAFWIAQIAFGALINDMSVRAAGFLETLRWIGIGN